MTVWSVADPRFPRLLLPPPTKLGEGNIFTGVCLFTRGYGYLWYQIPSGGGSGYVWGWVCSGGSRIFWRGCVNSQKCYYFSIFLPKTAWKWKNLDPMGEHVPGEPLGSANGMSGDGYVQSGVGIPGGSMSTWMSISGVGMSMGGVCPGVGTHPSRHGNSGGWVATSPPPPDMGTEIQRVTFDKRVVRILLECFFIWAIFPENVWK